MKSRKKLKWLGLLSGIMAATIILTACAGNENGTASGDTYPNAQLLVDAAWLEEHADEVKIVDVRSRAYEDGHLPGAISLTTNLIHDPDADIGNKLIDAERFTDAIQAAGINQDDTVVIYDGGNALQASRLFYALEYYGKNNVKILDGGYAGWLTAGKEIEFEPANFDRGDFVAVANEDRMADKDFILTNLDSEDIIFIDSRSEAEYTGEDLRNNAKGGHIPGAHHIEWNVAVAQGEDGVERFKSYEELKRIYSVAEENSDKTIVPYCQTNVRGAHAYFALRLLGHENIRPYENSMVEWNNLEDTPVEK